MKKLTAFLLGLCLVTATGARAAIDLTDFGGNQELEDRYHTLVTELRCLVCQNQTIADSNADLAKDLRREVHDMLVAGKTDDEIKDFMLERYGDFVLYKPPVRSSTVPLWLGPFILLAIGLVVVVVIIRRRTSQAQLAMNSQDRERASKLLDETSREQRS
jgi:cytochrome c-type biogenesis protein CcmH